MDPKDKGKAILVEPKKKKRLTLRQLRDIEAAISEEVARKMQEDWDAEELQKQAAAQQPRPKTKAQERNFL